MHCPNCGKELNGNPKFCGGCGTPVSQMIQQQAPVQAPVSEPVPSAIPATPAAVPEQTSMPSAPVTEPVQTAAPAAEPEKPAVSVAPVAAPAVVLAAEPAKSAFGSNEASAPATPAPTTPAPAVQTAPANVPPKKKSKLGLIIGLSAAGLVLIAGIAVGVVFAVKNMMSDTETTKKTKVEVDEDETEKTKETTSNGTTATQEPVSTTAKRTVMIYAIGSDLESGGGYFTADFCEMLAADPSTEVNIVLQTGGCKQFQNDLMTGGITQRFAIYNGEIYTCSDDSLNNANMVEPSTLTDFIEFSQENFPAEHYILVLWDHGGGVPLSFGVDELHAGETLSEVEIAYAIASSGVEFETIIFDACLMGSLEVAKALDPYTEYVVAAESVTWGTGIDYTKFLNTIGDGFTGDAQDYTEHIVRDYMDSISALEQEKGIDYDACMSAIDTDYINEVFVAYEGFIALLDKRVFEQDGYAEYSQIRESCGSFNGSDSVDLITLAQNYIKCGDQALESAASNLENEVGNCVYTKSNHTYTYAHGLTAYSPCAAPEYYNEGRVSFVELGYSDTTIKFYDKFVSAKLYYLNATSYAGSWYIKPADADSVSSGEAIDITDSVVKSGNNTVIDLNDSAWDIIARVEVSLIYMSNEDNIYYYLGTDQHYDTDSNGDIIWKNPSKWVYFTNIGFATSQCLLYEKYSDGSWFKMLGAAALVNGQEAFVVIGFSSDNPDGSILGYYLADIVDDGNILNNNIDLNHGYGFTDDDTINFVSVYVDINTGKIDYRELGNAVTYSEAVSLYKYAGVNYEDVPTFIRYDIYDVYNNDYYTDFLQGSSN